MKFSDKFKHIEVVSDDQPCFYCNLCGWRYPNAVELSTLDLVVKEALQHLIVCR